MKRMSKERMFKQKVENELGNKFFSLKGTKKYDKVNLSIDDSDFFSFDIKEINEDNSTDADHHAHQNQVVFGSDDESDNSASAAVNRVRESVGGTDIMNSLFSP